MVTDTQGKTYTEAQYAELQKAKDIVIRDLQKELRETRGNLEDATGRVVDLQGQLTAYENTVKGLELEPDAAARLQKIIKGEGELSRRTSDYNTAKTKLEKEAKPIREKALKQYADELAAKSQGQFTVDTLLAQGDEAKMDRYWLDHYNPAAVKPPETPPGQGDDHDKKGPEDKSGLPGLPGAGGTPGATKETDSDFLKKMYPNSPQMWGEK